MARALRGALRRAAAGIWGDGSGGDRSARHRGPHQQQQQAPPRPSSSSKQEELASGAAFCLASLAMTLLNKAALSPHHDNNAPKQHNLPLPVVSLLALQCLCTLLLTYAACALGLGRLPPRLAARELKLWLPVNFLFASMVATSFLALKHMGVPMLTVLKNLTSLLVIAGDRWVFGKTYGLGVWLTLALMTASAFFAAASDLEFSARGYAWQLANNLATAAYSLALRLAIVRMRDEEEEEEGEEGAATAGAGAGHDHHQEVEDGRGKRPSTTTGATPSATSTKRPDDVGMVIYNNLGALPLLVLLAVASGEPARLLSAPAGELRALASDRRFVGSALSSCVTGFLLSVASMWFMRCTTATTFSLVGSLNKVPLAVLGALLFAPPPGQPPAWASPWHVASVAVGLLAGAVFAHAKSREDAGRSGGGGGGGWANKRGSPRGGGGSGGHEHRR
jgi:GDP-mannose transporter